MLFTESQLREIGYLHGTEKLLHIRNLWRASVGVDSFNSIAKVHWQYIESIENLLANSRPNSELSCTTYVEEPYRCFYVGGVGVLLEGVITLAGESDLGTTLLECGNRMVKTTTACDRLVNAKVRAPYEIALADWTPKAIVVDLSFFDTLETGADLRRAVTLARLFELPLVGL